MIYVMSDIHGEYKKYLRMLDKIDFCDSDTLYLLGDVCDRGDYTAEIYLDIMERDNVHLIKGNHELFLESLLGVLIEEFPEGMEGTDLLNLYARREFYTWFINGGDVTVASVFEYGHDDRKAILDFVRGLPSYLTLEHGGIKYIMVHGGLGDYREGMTVEDVSAFDLAWSQPDFDGSYFDADTRVIVGHTPTFHMTDTLSPSSIYRGKGNVIAVDCGAAYPVCKGRLGCLCLDDNREFYV